MLSTAHRFLSCRLLSSLHSRSLLRAGTITNSSGTPLGSGNTGSTCRIINNKREFCHRLQARARISGLDLHSLQIKHHCLLFTIASWISLNMQAEKDFEICLPASRKVEQREWTIKQGKKKQKEKFLLWTLEGKGKKSEYLWSPEMLWLNIKQNWANRWQGMENLHHRSQELLSSAAAFHVTLPDCRSGH